MKIQYNTDKTIDGNERNAEFFSDQIRKRLERFQSQITRIEVHISDENGKKDGSNDHKCLLEARLEGMQPIAVSNQADTLEEAVSGAIAKLKNALQTILGKLSSH